jgi:hypothetical protein
LITRRLAALALAATFLAPSLFPQERRRIPYDEREMHLQEIYTLERENARAIQLNNSSFVASAYADEFTGVTWYGEVISKAKLISLIQTAGNSCSRVVQSDIQIKMFLDTASVMSLRSEHCGYHGKALDRQFRVLRVYIYSPRGWKVVSQLETQLPGSIPK